MSAVAYLQSKVTSWALIRNLLCSSLVILFSACIFFFLGTGKNEDYMWLVVISLMLVGCCFECGWHLSIICWVLNAEYYMLLRVRGQTWRLWCIGVICQSKMNLYIKCGKLYRHVLNHSSNLFLFLTCNCSEPQQQLFFSTSEQASIRITFVAVVC